MKSKILYFASLCVGCILLVQACSKTEDPDSVAKLASVPYIAYSYLDDVYIYGQGNTHLYSDLPDVIGVAVDSILGFEGGYGGKTGKDSIKIHKNELVFVDTISAGASGFSVYKSNKGSYRVSLGSSVVIAKANTNPGPTALEGIYKRNNTAGYLLTVGKIGTGIYLITNPGGAASVGPVPYLLYNFKSSVGTDSLSFACQTDGCGGGLQLGAPGCPLGLTSAEYTAQYPPAITSYTPVTFKWVVLEFPSTKPTAVNYGVGTCAWGTSTRTFEKQ
ncbi:MAG: hypothetical protein WCR52_15315 [Bacteroidota bacterium]|jgi:hypothetical protein